LYTEVNSLLQQGRFRECIEVTQRQPPTAQVLTLRIECASAISDSATLEKACDELAERFPQYRSPGSCAKSVAQAQALRQSEQYVECVEFGLRQSRPTILLIVEMYRCAGELRDRDVSVRVCRYAAEHFPETYDIKGCPEPLPKP
jgi:hypothetical protein